MRSMTALTLTALLATISSGTATCELAADATTTTVSMVPRRAAGILQSPPGPAPIRYPALADLRELPIWCPCGTGVGVAGPFPDAEISVAVVWIDILPSDNREQALKATERFLDDPRVRFFYDDKRVTGESFMKSVPELDEGKVLRGTSTCSTRPMRSGRASCRRGPKRTCTNSAETAARCPGISAARTSWRRSARPWWR